MNVWRDRLSRWFDPLARACPLSPNVLTTIALAFNLIAAAMLYYGRWRPTFFLLAMAVLIIGGLLDTFDGIVARVQGKTSRFGDFYDHVADRISDTCLLTGWVMGNNVRSEIIVASIIAVMMNGYVGTQLEATFAKREYDTLGRAEFVLALVTLPLVSYIMATNGLRFHRGGFELAEWLTILLIVFAIAGIVQRIRLARRLSETS